MHIYVIGPAPGPFKIGVTNNPGARRRTLQTGHHQKLLVIYSAVVANDLGRRLEAHVHWLLDAKLIAGEWFEVSAREAIEAIEQSIADERDGKELKTRKGYVPRERTYKNRSTMTPAEFCVAMEALSLSRVRLQRLFGLDKGTPSRWAQGQIAIPNGVAILIRAMREDWISIEELEQLKAADDAGEPLPL